MKILSGKNAAYLFRTVLILLLTIALCIPQTVNAAGSEDSTITWLIQKGFVTEEFNLASIKKNPNKRISRQAFISVLMLAAGEKGTEYIDEASEATVKTTYKNGKKVKDSILKYLNTAYALGVLPTQEDITAVKLYPLSTMTRQMAAYYIGHCLNMHIDLELKDSSDFKKVNDACKPYVTAMVSEGILRTDSYGAFNPKGKLTWKMAGELIKSIYEAGYFDTKEVNLVAGRSSIGTEPKANEFLSTEGIAIDKSTSTIYVADTRKNQIKAIKNGIITVIAGKETIGDFDGTYIGGHADGASEDALFNKPTGVLLMNEGLLVSDTGNNVLRLIDLTAKTVTTYAGTGIAGAANGLYNSATFNSPREAAIAEDGTIYVADTGNNCIRMIDTKGYVTTLTGFSHKDGYKDGTLSEALFNRPTGIAISGTTLYIADCGNQRIRKISNGTVSTLAGSGIEIDVNSSEYIGGYINGAALEARFNYPIHVTVGDNDTIYVSDAGNRAVRRISDGLVTTIAGFGYYAGQTSFSWMGRLERPGYITYSEQDKCLYVTDSFLNHVISVEE